MHTADLISKNKSVPNNVCIAESQCLQKVWLYSSPAVTKYIARGLDRKQESPTHQLSSFHLGPLAQFINVSWQFSESFLVHQFLWDNLVDKNRTYEFEVDLVNPMARRRKFVAIRNEVKLLLISVTLVLELCTNKP